MNRAGRASALVIHDGGVPALVACWLELRRRRTAEPILWFPGRPLRPAPAWAAEARHRAVVAHAELAPCGTVHDATGQWGGAGPAAEPEWLAEPSILLAACAAARQLGLSHVVWPAHSGPEPAGAARAGRIRERASLVSGLAAMADDDDPRSPAVETPLADLTDVQVADLGIDLDAPLWAAWECELDGPRPCDACAGCLRWRAAMLAADPAGAIVSRMGSKISGGAR